MKKNGGWKMGDDFTLYKVILKYSLIFPQKFISFSSIYKCVTQFRTCYKLYTSAKIVLMMWQPWSEKTNILTIHKIFIFYLKSHLLNCPQWNRELGDDIVCIDEVKEHFLCTINCHLPFGVKNRNWIKL